MHARRFPEVVCQHRSLTHVVHVLYRSRFLPQRMIIIRAPSIFRYAWAVAKHFFRQSLRRKMIFASKNYLRVLDEFVSRDVLPPSIAEGGIGKVAIGMPPLIGDVDYRYYDFHSQLVKNGTGKATKSLLKGFSSRISLAETDDGSTASDEPSWDSSLSLSGGSVSSSYLLKGVWIDQEDGSSEIFTRGMTLPP